MKTYEPRPNPHNIPPHPKVMSRRGRIKTHAYKPPQDDPAPGPCWDCCLDEDHPVHRQRHEQNTKGGRPVMGFMSVEAAESLAAINSHNFPRDYRTGKTGQQCTACGVTWDMEGGRWKLSGRWWPMPIVKCQPRNTKGGRR